jgi:hypothetical protein
LPEDRGRVQVRKPMEARKFHLEREMIVLKAPKLRRAAQNLCKRAEGHSRSLIKEKAHPEHPEEETERLEGRRTNRQHIKTAQK